MNQKIQSKNEYFTKRMFYRFFIPSVTASIVLSLGNIVDAVVIGAKIGETGLAAIGLVSPIFMVFNVFDVGIAIGGSVGFTKLMGEGKASEAKNNFMQMLYMTLFFSITIGALGSLFLKQILAVLGTTPSDGALYSMVYNYAKILFLSAPLFFINFLLYYYIRCDDNQKLASIGFVAGSSVDILLNIVFVIILNFGVKGAIAATVIGKIVAIIIYLPHIFFRKSTLKIKLVKPQFFSMIKYFKTGFASSSQYVFQFLFFITVNNLLIKIDGARGLAVFDVVINVSYVLLSVYEGLGSVIQPLCATFFGEKNYTAQRSTIHLSMKWGLTLGTICTIFIVFFAENICLFFGLDPATTKSIGINALRLYCPASLLAGISIIYTYFYQSVEREKLAFLIIIMRTSIYYILFSFVFGILGINYFFITFFATEFITLITWLFIKTISNKNKKSEKFNKERIYNKTIDDKIDDFSVLTSQTEEFCEKWEASPQQQYYVILTVEEICQAIINNGFTNLKDNYIEITLIANEDGSFELHIRDNATKFNPFDMKTFKIDKNLDNDLDSIGILMIKKNVKQMFYRRYQGFNTLTVLV